MSPAATPSHDLLRVYAAELTRAYDDEADRHAALTRLLDHYTHTAHWADRLLFPLRDVFLPLGTSAPGAQPEKLADTEQAIAWLAAEHAVLLTAAGHAVRAGLGTHAWRLAWGLTTFLDRRGRWRDLIAVWETVLGAAGALTDPLRGHAHGYIGDGFFLLGRRDDADPHYQRGLELHLRAGDLIGQAYAHRRLGRVAQLGGDADRGLAEFRRSLELCRAAGHRRGEALALNTLAYGLAMRGDFLDALPHCQEALRLLEELDDPVGLAATWHSAGFVHQGAGDHRQAVRCYERSAALHRELGDGEAAAFTLIDLGEAHQAVGDFVAAGRIWNEALAVVTELGIPEGETVRTRLRDLERRAAASTRPAPVGRRDR